jgi:hypothetical protein
MDTVAKLTRRVDGVQALVDAIAATALSLTRRDGPDSKSKKRPPTSSEDGDES